MQKEGVVIYPVGVIGDLAVDICMRALQKDEPFQKVDRENVIFKQRPTNR